MLVIVLGVIEVFALALHLFVDYVPALEKVYASVWSEFLTASEKIWYIATNGCVASNSEFNQIGHFVDTPTNLHMSRLTFTNSLCFARLNVIQ